MKLINFKFRGQKRRILLKMTPHLHRTTLAPTLLTIIDVTLNEIGELCEIACDFWPISSHLLTLLMCTCSTNLEFLWAEVVQLREEAVPKLLKTKEKKAKVQTKMAFSP